MVAKVWFAAASFLITLGAIPPCMRLARHFGIVDRPTHRKIHSEPVPYLGGVAMMLGILVGIGLLLWSYDSLTPTHLLKVALIGGAAFCAAVLGLVDDKFGLLAHHKLLCQFLIILAFVFLGYHIEVVTLPGLGVLELNDVGVPFTVIWMLAVVNGLNLIDGVDGLAG
jgi:UDP-GlcNAc:undecaprenyl-phosphate/decaprenyl-phosphate GlcNAc-1-phosphate transferase